VKKNTGLTIKYFLLISSLHMLTITWAFFSAAIAKPTLNYLLVFNVFTWVGYSFFYVFLAILPVYLIVKFAPSWYKLAAVMAITLSSFMMLFMKSDAMIFDLYNFHFNGFVWNLMTTKGGISSLGSGADTYASIIIACALIVFTQIILWFLSEFLARKRFINMRWKYAVSFVMLMLLSTCLMYSISDVKNYGPILDSAKVYPFYKKVTFRGIAEKFGIKAARVSSNQLSVDTSLVQYPLNQIKFNQPENPPNIVILVAESLRWDRLTPEIMPNTWQFAQKAYIYKEHYSSGNGTREGLFGLFYGLYGSYWDSFLHAQKSPLLMDRLQQLGYQFDIRTSASFTYPEFNKTLFSNIPLAQLHEAQSDKTPWENDRDNATNLITALKNRDKNKPFMSFFFFESTHARYSFPDTNIIAQPYLQDVNYFKMSRASLAPKVDQLKNRYTNSAHWIDIQLGRVYDDLRNQGLLENTIVIVTGDHGEEFMEKGFWGHNSSFVEEQTHTPMVISVPKLGHREINNVTSHVDVSTTLLQMLGAPTDSSAYSLGVNMLTPIDRQFIVTSDWHSISVMTADMKYRIPYASKGFDHWTPTNQKDKTLNAEEAEKALAQNQSIILQAIKNCRKFLVGKVK
jgi:uncharacterized protein